MYRDRLSAGAPKVNAESTLSPCKLIKSPPTAIAQGFSLVWALINKLKLKSKVKIKGLIEFILIILIIKYNIFSDSIHFI
jgi:hypothetical protein